MKCEHCGAQIKDTLTSCPLCGGRIETSANDPAPHNIWDVKKTPPAKANASSRQDTEIDGVRSGDRSETDSRAPGKPAQKRVKIHWGRFLAFVGAVILAAGALVFAAVFGVRTLRNSMESRRLAAEEAEQAKLPLVERVLLDGAYWHRITFYGEDGSRVLIDNPRETLAIHNGLCEFMLEDSALIPDNPDTDSVEVNLSATLIHADGTEEAIPTVNYSVEVPQAYLKMIDPSEQSITSNETRLLITMKVDTGSRVLLGDSNITDLVNADGIITSSVPIRSIGVNTVTITVEAAKHRRTVYELQVTREPMDVRIVLDDDIATSTEDGAVRISGMTDPGAVITTDAQLEKEITYGEDGSFSFTAALSKYGWNLIQIHAQKDGKDSTLGYQVRHVPNLESYTRSAWAMDYNYLSVAAETLTGQVFLCKGEITEFLDDDLTTLMRFNCGEPNHPQYIILEYSGDASLNVGTQYRIYADVVGTYEDLPRLAARFVYTS